MSQGGSLSVRQVCLITTVASSAYLLTERGQSSVRIDHHEPTRQDTDFRQNWKQCEENDQTALPSSRVDEH